MRLAFLDGHEFHELNFFKIKKLVSHVLLFKVQITRIHANVILIISAN